jgi:HAMP domain-containing protein
MIGWAVVGFVLHAVEFLVIAALLVGAVAVAIKVARSGKQISRKDAKREVREPDYSQPLPRADVEHVTTSYSSQPTRQSAPDIDEELARLKREMGA